jgi:phospholipase C
MASQYVLSDDTFESNNGPSFPAHLYLIAGQSGHISENASGDPWGCDAPPSTTTQIGLPDWKLGPGPFPCFYYDTLATRLNSASLSWKFYTPALNQAGGNLWLAFDSIHPIRYSPYWTTNIISPETTILSDIPNGKLPAVSWVIPSFSNSDHPASFSNSGPDWVGGIVNSIGKSKYWDSTAVFILWDDWGGWYDDVSPPQLDFVGLGFRVPFIVVSPYAKHNYVSHAQYEYGSILKFAEWAFGLPSLQESDDRANPLFDCFDFTQSPQPYHPLLLRRTPHYFLTAPPDHRAPDEE